MNPPDCEREPQILQAIRNGNASPDLAAHAQSCPVCSEVWPVAEFLREETTLASHELNALPDPGLIWRKAQARAREKALAKAILPIRIMRTCALVLAIFAAPWLISQLVHAPAWLHNLGLDRFSFTDQSLFNQGLINRNLINPSWTNQGWLNQSWLGALTGTTLLGISITLACIAAGSWYMLREK
jgi:hypothetical protein